MQDLVARPGTFASTAWLGFASVVVCPPFLAGCRYRHYIRTHNSHKSPLKETSCFWERTYQGAGTRYMTDYCPVLSWKGALLADSSWCCGWRPAFHGLPVLLPSFLFLHIQSLLQFGKMFAPKSSNLCSLSLSRCCLYSPCLPLGPIPHLISHSQERLGASLYSWTIQAFCVIHGLVSPVESGVRAPRTTSLWQMPEKRKGGRDWKPPPWFRVLWKYVSLQNHLCCPWL